MMSLNAFSQTAIDSTKIQLTKPIAKLVIKDLIKFDGLSKEVVNLKSILDESNYKLDTQSKLLLNLESQNKNLEAIIRELDVKYETQSRLTKDFESALKRQKRQASFYKIGSVVGAAATILLLVQ